jgi:hypothetical protein
MTFKIVSGFAIFFLTASALSGCMTTAEENKQPQALATQVKVHRFKNLDPVGRAYFPREFLYNEGGWSGSSRVQPSQGVFVRDEFWTVNDRGLNLYLEEKDSTKEASFRNGDRYFPAPRHQQNLFKIKLNSNGTGVIVERLGLRENGLPANGLPSALDNLGTNERGWEMKTPVGPFARLANSLQGYDFEGVAQDFDENRQREFWLVEEYGPSLLRAGSSGNILKRWSPARNFSAKSNSLPWSLRHRADNRGFEGLTISGQFVLAAMQSPLSADGGASGEAGHGNPNTPLHRIIRLNRKTGTVEQFAYNHTDASVAAGSPHKDVKIGDLAAVDSSGERFLVLEHSKARKHIAVIEAQISKETTRLEDNIIYEAGKKPYTAMQTRVVADLAPLLKDLELPEKAEGITVIDDKTLLVLFDNDHCIEPLLAKVVAPKECENLAVTFTFADPVFSAKTNK